MTSHNHLPPLHSPPPNLTLRYTFDSTTPPADISIAFFNITEIPHVRYFYSGKKIIVRLADIEDYTNHTNITNTRKLMNNGFHLVESVQARMPEPSWPSGSVKLSTANQHKRLFKT
ncbi:hypothetical protein GWK47_000971 [Chionoecetes opilio]|uniref:Uncharacterized protein n=1 Tax=Chionoecetes opilio TaxID=41210 RepID=A0A8J4XZB5_CHIOP|nr:hypothetical protein GWK47_000971 [Chionoecetes opilio]